MLTITSASADYEGLYRCVADFGDSVTAESTAALLVIFGLLCTLCTRRSDQIRINHHRDSNISEMILFVQFVSARLKIEFDSS